MTRLQHISFIFIAVVLLFGITDTVISADTKHDAEHTNEENHRSSSVLPEDSPELFAINRQARSAVNLLRILPVPNAKNNDQGTGTPGWHSEVAIFCALATYLYFSRDLNQSLTIRELIFPFHHFL